MREVTAGVDGLSPVPKAIAQARLRIAGTAEVTPVVRSALPGAEVWLKLETLQPVGAFKIRGAANAILSLSPEARVRGVVCCSTGNHGRAVAYVAARAGVRAVVCLSSLVPAVKADAIAALGAEVRRVGSSQDEAEDEAARLVTAEGLVNISPFDDPAVVAGQGTIGLELLEQVPGLRTVVVGLSGGGLAGGIARAVKAADPGICVVGISMDRGAAMAASLAAGKPVEVQEYPSLADSLGGGIGRGNRVTFALCKALLDEVILVTEDEIYDGLRWLILHDRIVAEGASAVGHAALLAGKLRLDGPAAFVVSGRNLPAEQIAAVASGQPVVLGDVVARGTT